MHAHTKSEEKPAVLMQRLQNMVLPDGPADYEYVPGTSTKHTTSHKRLAPHHQQRRKQKSPPQKPTLPRIKPQTL